MIFQKHYINNQLVNLPRNYRQLGIRVNFNENRIDEEQVSITTFTWQDKEAAILLSLFQAGVTGGNGVFEGVPHRIEVSDGSTTTTIFDGYIDLGSAEFDRAEVTASSHYRASVDWLSDVASAITFEQLKDKGFIDESQYVFVPYVIRFEGYAEILLMGVTFAFIVAELRRMIAKFFPEGVAQLPTGLDTIGGIIQLVFSIAYLILMFAILVDIILDTFNLLIQKVKYKPAMYAIDLCKAGAKYFNLEFESNILNQDPWNKLIVIPPSYSNPLQDSEDRVRGFFTPNRQEQNGFFAGTFSDLLTGLKILFNGVITYPSGKIKLEPKIFRPVNGARVKLAAVDQERYRTNTKEIMSNLSVSFAYDISDTTTIDEWKGTNVQVIQLLKQANDPQLRLTQGLKQVQIPFALAKRKTDLTAIERIVQTLLEFVSVLINTVVNLANKAIEGANKVLKAVRKTIKFLNNIGLKIKWKPPIIKPVKRVNLGQLIENRIGMMHMSSDILTVHKLGIFRQGTTNRESNLDPRQNDFLRAKYIAETFYTDTFRQGVYWNVVNVPISLNEYNQVVEDRRVINQHGNECEVIEFEWQPDTQMANFVLFEPITIMNNLETKTYEPIGR